MVEKLKERYLKNFMRKDQLWAYVRMGIITKAQMEEIIAE